LNILCNDVNEQVFTVFRQQSLNRRIQIIKQYLSFLTDICKGYQDIATDGYYNIYFRATIAFLANKTDRKLNIYNEILNIMGVWLVDQFFFAHRFFSDELMDEFRIIFRERVTRSSNLVNLALCMTAHLDLTSDLETVAMLSFSER
jgi:hypothetical protein